MSTTSNTPHYAGHRQRLRDRFRKTGGEDFRDYEWLELLLTYAIPRRDVKPVAKRLLDEHGDLASVLRADPEELQKVDGIGEVSATFFALLKLISARYLEEELRQGESLGGPEDVVDFARTRLAGEKTEHFLVIYLDGWNRVLSTELIETGIEDEVKVYPRKIMNRAVKIQATRLIFVHNHPSGVLEPSPGDRKLTERLCRGASTLGIKVLDHLIVTESGFRRIQ
jgi:DNA repair protein RadC